MSTVKLSKKTVINFCKSLLVYTIVLSISWVLLYRFISPPITFLMVSKTFSSNEPINYEPLSFFEISQNVKVCAIASEDQNLPFHNGIDIEAIQKAFRINKNSKKTFGASTITQQVAKNAFLFPSRSFVRKGLELYFSVIIETFWNKEKILETYLNIAEMGNQIYGIGAASKYYYNKNANRINLSEASKIIAILPNPIKYSAKNPGPYVLERSQEIKDLYFKLDGANYLRELYVKTDKSLYDFRKYRK